MQKGAIDGGKHCKSCGDYLPIDAFERNRPGGIYRSECKKCRSWRKPMKGRAAYERAHPRPEIGSMFKCPVCLNRIKVEQNRDVNLDHDQTTGTIRGWVCNHCNTGMGYLKDDPNIIKRAYLWLTSKF